MNEDFIGERKYANYFDVVDLIERVLPPKQEVNYIQVEPYGLVKKFNDEMEKSGFYFRENILANVRKVLLDYQKYNYQRNSVYVGGVPGRDYGFDQNNYSIQNNLSEMKNRIIGMLTQSNGILVPGKSYDVDGLGTLEEVKDKTSRRNIEDYVRNVLDVTWEPKGDIRAELQTLATDIMLHFGVSTGDYFGNSRLFNEIISALDRLYYSSKDFRGPIDREGNYNSAVTNKEAFDRLLEETVFKVTEMIYSAIKDTLDDVEKYQEERKAKKESAETFRIPDAAIPKDKLGFDEVYVVPDSSMPIKEEKPKEESLESTIKKYEQLQALIAENLELAKKLAEAKKIVEESERKLKENEEKMQALR